MSLAQSKGNYQYLPGDGRRPFCQAVLADAGYEIVRAQFDKPIPWRLGFDLIESHLKSKGRPRQSLCSVELRCKEPYTPAAFDAFNAEYAALLKDWGLIVDGLGTTTRTNVAPEPAAPREQMMFAFAYTAPAADAPPTFVISGAPESVNVRPNETSPAALKEKTADVVKILTARLVAIGQSWHEVTQVAIYTPHDALPAIRSELLPLLGPAALEGLRWFPSRPPIVGFEMEIDARRLRNELRLSAP